MYKERIVGTPDYGSGIGPYYSSQGISGDIMNARDIYTEQVILDQFKSADLVNLLSPPDFVGLEQFMSEDRRRPNWNSCKHLKQLCYVQRSHGYCAFFYTTRYGTRITTMAHAQVQSGITNYNLPDVPAAFFDGQFSARAWHSLQPRIGSEVSIINSIYELKDFKQLAKSIISGISSIRKWTDQSVFNRILKDQHKRIDPTLPISEAILMVNLAIKPTIMDVSNMIVQAATEVQRIVETFEQKGSYPHTVHYSENSIDSSSVPEPTDYTPYGVGYLSSHRLTASMERSYSYRPESSYREFMKYWGLDLNATAIWNMLPFSFVLDYITSISKSIKMMEHQRGVTLDLNQYAESIFATSMGGKFYTHLDGPLTFDGSTVVKYTDRPRLVTGKVNSTFERRTGLLPNKAPALPRFHSMSSKQALNTMALLRALF